MAGSCLSSSPASPGHHGQPLPPAVSGLAPTQSGKQAFFILFKVFLPAFGNPHWTVFAENVNVCIQ